MSTDSIVSEVPSHLPEFYRISYQVPRNVIIWTWWRRMTLRPGMIIRLSAMPLIGLLLVALSFVLPSSSFGYTPFYATLWFRVCFLLFTLFTSLLRLFSIYRILAKAINADSAITDRLTLEFGPSHLMFEGPDWRNEMTWTKYGKGFSEDTKYFYLDIGDAGLCSIIPKSAFTEEQGQKFREYANTNFE